MVCCFNPNLIQHYSASIRPAGRFCDWTRNCSRILPLILYITLLFLRKGRLPLYRAAERLDLQWQANTDWDRRTWHIDIPTQNSVMRRSLSVFPSGQIGNQNQRHIALPKIENRPQKSIPQPTRPVTPWAWQHYVSSFPPLDCVSRSISKNTAHSFSSIPYQMA